MAGLLDLLGMFGGAGQFGGMQSIYNRNPDPSLLAGYQEYGPKLAAAAEGQMRAGTPGYNPNAPSPGLLSTGVAGQGGMGGGGWQDRLQSGLDNPLTQLGIGLLSQGDLGKGLAAGAQGIQQTGDRRQRRALLGLQTQATQASLEDKQRLRGQAAQYRATLPPDSPLVALPDEQLLAAAGTLATRETPEQAAAKARATRETPEEAAAKAVAIAQGTLPIDRQKAGFNEPLVQIPDDSSPTGFRNVPRSQAVGQPGIGPGGLQMEFGPDGKPTLIRSGPGAGAKGGGSGLAQPTLNKLDEKMIDAGEGLARLDQIERGYRPEFQQFGTRIGAGWTALKSSMGAKLDPNDKKLLTEFTTFKRDATDNLNKGIKEATGSAMGVDEAKRIIASMPNVGAGVFDGDSPVEFEAKLKGSTTALRNAYMRAAWARSKGVDPLKSGVSLEEVPKLIDKRGDEIAAELRAKGGDLDDQAIRTLVRRRLATEFGMLK